MLVLILFYVVVDVLVKQVFSDMDFIGWYITGDVPNMTDIKIHKQICEINESPIMLKLNPFDKNIDVSAIVFENLVVFRFLSSIYQ